MIEEEASVLPEKQNLWGLDGPITIEEECQPEPSADSLKIPPSQECHVSRQGVRLTEMSSKNESLFLAEGLQLSMGGSKSSDHPSFSPPIR